MKDYVYTSPFATKWIGVGRDEGLKEGLDEGAKSAHALNVLTVLRVRGINVSDKARERILAEKDITRLERWLERAVVASSLDDVFTDPS